MNRRSFLLSGSALAVHGLLPAQDNPTPAQLRLSNEHLPSTMSEDFVGLSYESAQLQNPDFFSPENTQLVQLFRALSPRGVLRLGGNLSDFTFWSNSPAPTPTPEEQETAKKIAGAYEWKLVDPIAAKPRYTVITPRAIKNLGGFPRHRSGKCSER